MRARKQDRKMDYMMVYGRKKKFITIRISKTTAYYILM